MACNNLRGVKYAFQWDHDEEAVVVLVAINGKDYEDLAYLHSELEVEGFVKVSMFQGLPDFRPYLEAFVPMLRTRSSAS